MSTRPCRPVYGYLVHDVKPACEDDDDDVDDDDDDGDGGAHSITGTGSPLTAAHNNLNSLGEHRPDSVQCSAFTAAGCCLGQRGTHSLAAVAADEFNQRKEFKINIALHQPDICQVWTTGHSNTGQMVSTKTIRKS